MRRFEPGEHVTLREVWRSRTWTLRAVTVVHDRDDLIALHLPHGASRRRAVSLEGEPMRLPDREWQLHADTMYHHTLRLNVPGEHSATFAIWDEEWNFLYWYINLEQPLTRADHGFEYMDQTLDIVIKPDLSTWEWKDEDELQSAIDSGLYPPSLGPELRTEGERALERLLARRPPLDEKWEDWRPNPSWGHPAAADWWEKE